MNAYSLLSYRTGFSKKKLNSPILNFFFKSVTVTTTTFYAMQDSQIKMGFIPAPEKE